jgi:dipeptidyl-peptidase-4
MKSITTFLCVCLAGLIAVLDPQPTAAASPRPKLQVINGSKQEVEVFWLKDDTERVSNGSIAPRKNTTITTTIGHRFVIVGQEDKAEITVTSAVLVQAVRFDPPDKDGVPAFYTQRVTAHGYPIVASAKVNPYALKEAAYLVDLMLAKRPDVREAMIKSGSRLSILAWNEFTTDQPEWKWMATEPDEEASEIPARDFWDARARGMGGSETDPFCSCGEENLLAYAGDPYSTENILIHEFAHNIHLRGLVNVDPTFDARLKETYRSAMKAGLWKGKYAAVNHHEYFAEGVQSWFDDNRENDHDHNHVNTRAELLEYDPGLAAVCREVFGDTVLKYTKPTTRLTGHMAGYDPTKAPQFVWPERLTHARKVIRAKAVARDAAANGKSATTNQPTQNVATDPALLTLERIFASGEFRERGLGAYKWSRRTASYFTLEAPQTGGKGRELVRNDTATGLKEIVVPGSAFIPEGHSEPLNVESFEFSADESRLLLYTNSRRVWRRNTRGDYWALEVATRQLRKLGGNAAPSTLMFAKFSPDGTRVAYVRENNIYVQDLRSMRIVALTRDGSSTLINGTSDWVNEEELSIRDAFRWSPDGRSIAFWQFDTSGVRQFHLINNTADTYPKITSFVYPKVGETNSATRLGLISATGGRVRWLEIPGDPRNHYIPHAEWSPDGKRLLVQQFNRLQNTNRVMLADAKSGAIRTVLTETDAAWLENENPAQWMDNGSKFLWLSERDGWRHAYLAGTDGRQFARITGGDFDVIQVEAMDEKNGWLYFSASPENPTQHYLYRARLGGGTPERLSPVAQPGWHTYDFSPDAQWAMHTYSTITNPPVVELVQLPGHKVVRVLADNQKLREKLATLRLPTAELLKVDIGDGVSLDAWCLKPPGLNPSAKYPLLIHVYGEPASQSVSDRWHGGSGLWHWMLAQQGYIVASIENRGTPVPRGRTWRKMAFRQVGILAAQDQAAGVQALLKLWPYADAGRVGVWGWSGGGSMSLNAIFRYPDLYSTAMAVAPNASQLLYDTIYQERYMGLPQDNAENYRLGSPITHASQLKGNLLLVHGTGDDNGHYQGTERLMNELIAHHKHFTVMPYPNRSHSISEGTNTVRHFYGTLTRYLHEHLAACARRPDLAPGKDGK